jgi:hypothetical protein
MVAKMANSVASVDNPAVGSGIECDDLVGNAAQCAASCAGLLAILTNPVSVTWAAGEPEQVYPVLSGVQSRNAPPDPYPPRPVP